VNRFEHAGRTVYRVGTGPAVIVIHEIPGLHAGVLAFGERLAAAGFTAYMPSLFGAVGEPMSVRTSLPQIARACVSREFATWAANKTSPIVTWLRALAKDAHAACGGPGVGAVGMCLTGGFALAMAVDPWLVAPVLSQPSIPFGITPAQRRSLGISRDDLETVKARDVCIMGLRFTGDPLVPAARFARLREEFGDRFLAIEIPGRGHSVLTEHLVDEPGHPTRDALERVLAFFADRLRPHD
jgi:dienelactone hydrolase